MTLVEMALEVESPVCRIFVGYDGNAAENKDVAEPISFGGQYSILLESSA